jgi:hypothetical protein
MAAREDDDYDDDRRPPRRRDRDDEDDDRGGRGRRRDDRDDDEGDRDRPRRRRREYDDEDYDPRPAPPSADAVVGNEIGLALGITGLVCGGAALSFSFIPCLGMWALWPGIISALISVIGIVVSTRMRAVPVAALLVSLAAVGFAINQRIQVEQAVDDAQKALMRK